MSVEAPVSIPVELSLTSMPPHIVGGAESLGSVNEGPVTDVLTSVPEAFTRAFSDNSSDEPIRIYNELREQPSLTSLEVDRLFSYAAAMGKSRRFYGWAEERPAQVESVQNNTAPTAASAPVAKTENRASYGVFTQPQIEAGGATKQSVSLQRKEEEKVEAPKVKKPKLPTIIFRKDEPVSAYRLARAKNKFKAMNQERNGGIVKGEELNARLGDEVSPEQSRLLSQLGIQDRKDGSNIPGFRKVLGTLVFNSLEDGFRKIHEANEKYIPVMIGGNGMVVDEKAVDAVLQGGVDKIRSFKLEYPQEGESSNRILLNQAH